MPKEHISTHHATPIKNSGEQEQTGKDGISLAPLDIKKALSGLFAILNLEATKPKNYKT